MLTPEQRIQQCISFMQEHLDEPLEVPSLAANVALSSSHFFSVFKRFTGSSPIDYFIRLRMERACRLLRDGPLPVKEVAAAVGYHDPFYFSRVFKSVLRVPPTEYRQRSAAQSPEAAPGSWQSPAEEPMDARR